MVIVVLVAPLVLVVPLVLVGSYGYPWLLWLSWFLCMVLVVLVVLPVLVVPYPVVVLVGGYPVVLAARSPSIGTTCGNLGVRDGMRVKIERMIRDERDTKN